MRYICPRQYVLAAVVVMALPAAAAADAVDDAYAVLNRRNIRYNREELVDLVRNNDAENVRIFLQAGMRPNMYLEGGRPLLHLAVHRGFYETAKVLVEGGASVNLVDRHKWTALMLACLLGDEKTAGLLLEKGANPNVRNDHGVTALNLTTERRYLGISRLLLAHGADPRIRAGSGVSALMIAVDMDHAETLKLYEEAGYGAEMRSLRKSMAAEDERNRAESEKREAEHQRKLEELKARAKGRD